MRQERLESLMEGKPIRCGFYMVSYNVVRMRISSRVSLKVLVDERLGIADETFHSQAGVAVL